MNKGSVTVNSLENSLNSIFNGHDWTSLQHQAYSTIRHYVSNYKENNKQYEIKDDKLIIRNNIRDQVWFIYSKAKPLIGHLLDTMTLNHYMCDNNDYCVNFQVVISFNKFNLHACLYKNKVNNFFNYYIFFENEIKQRAYMTYYTTSLGTLPSDNMKQLKLPEFSKIYSVIDMNPQVFYQYDLVNFFAEILMYYDDSGLLGDVQICYSYPVTLNQLISKFNSYIEQKNTENGYQIIDKNKKNGT